MQPDERFNYIRLINGLKRDAMLYRWILFVVTTLRTCLVLYR